MKEITWAQVLILVLEVVNLYFVFKLLNYRKREIAALREQNDLLIQNLEAISEENATASSL